MAPSRGVLRSLAPAVLLAFAASGVRADVLYLADDGTGSVNVGPSFPTSQMLWGNYFDVLPGGDHIRSVLIAFGSIPAGRNVTLLVFDDPDDDGNPDDAVPLAQTAGLTADPQTNIFVEYTLPPTPVSGGFFVAAMMDVTNTERPGRLDPQSISGQSWIAVDASINLLNLGGSPVFFNMNQNAVPGTWLVRAIGIPTPPSIIAALPLTILGRRARPRGAPSDG